MTATPHPRSDLVFEVRNLRKSFGGREILNGIDLVVKPCKMSFPDRAFWFGKEHLAPFDGCTRSFQLRRSIFVRKVLAAIAKLPSAGSRPPRKRFGRDACANSEWFFQRWELSPRRVWRMEERLPKLLRVVRGM